MDKKKLVKWSGIYLLLFLIVPVSLYINFFIAKKTVWDMHIKAWEIYSLLIILGEIAIIFLYTFLIKLLNSKFNILSENKNLNKFIRISIIAFLAGNLFFIFPVNNKLFLYVPIFQGGLIFLFLNIYLKPKSTIKRSWKDKFFKLERNKNKTESNSLIVFISIIFFIIVNTALQYYILILYKPYIKSLDYSVPDGYKIHVNKNPYEPKLF